MITFFSILFIIIGVNAVMLFINSNSFGKKTSSSVGITETSASKVYPLDMDSSKYKKAV